MKEFREWLREAKRYLFLPDVKVKNKNAIWNKQKTEAKFLSQLNERITAIHITDSEKLGTILEKGLNLKYSEFANGSGRNNDTCIRFKKSQFVVIFNKDEHSIIGIRKPLNNLKCNKEKIVMENLEAEERLFEELCIKAYDLNEPEDGILMSINENDRIQIQNVCKVCIEVDL
jgi:hypothetical protein